MGAIVNTICVILGAGLGLLIKKGLSEQLNDSIMKGVSLCVVIIGLQGALKVDNVMLMIIAIVLGAIIGESLNIEKAMEGLSYKLEHIFFKDAEDSQFAQGFLSAMMIFCVGAMAIVGSLESGLLGNHTTLYSKGMLDGIVAVLLASTQGIGVLFSAFAVLVYEGSMTILATLIGPYLSTEVIAAMSAIGNVLLFALGANMLGITKIRVMNYIPAVFLPILLVPLFHLLGF